MYEITLNNKTGFKVFSMHDRQTGANDIYFPAKALTAFNADKWRFIYKSIKEGIKSRIVVLSHINLLLAGYLVKLFSSKTKLVLIAHGIEVWQQSLPPWKKKILQKIDLIICVSRFTKEKMISLYELTEEKCTVLNNCLDPFLPPLPAEKNKAILRSKYNFHENDFLILTLSRLSSTEKNKGYDKILVALKNLSKQYPSLRYLFVGKYDEAEKSRLDKLIDELHLTGLVVFTGFVADEELAIHYSIANVYVMPSEKEGFGISFIEAMYYGVPVIAGNRDGSTDALCNGKLGILIDPRSQREITNAIRQVIENKQMFIPDRDLLIKKFSYDTYKNNLKNILEELKN